MKKFALSLLIAGLAGMSVAQVKIKEGRVALKKGSQNAYTVYFSGIDEGKVEKLWEDFSKKLGAKPKKVKKAKESMSNDLMVKNLSDNTVDIYSLSEASGEEVKFTLWFDLGGAWLATKTHPERVPAAQKLLNDFSLEVEAEKTKMELAQREEEVKEMEKALENMLKEQRAQEKEIEKYEEKIKEAEARIQESLTNQKLKQEEIKVKKEEVKETEKRLKTVKKSN